MLLREIDAEYNIDEASGVSSFALQLGLYKKEQKENHIIKTMVQRQKEDSMYFNVIFSHPGGPIQKKAQKLENWPTGSQQPPFSY